MCFGCLLESPRRGDSNKYPKHIFYKKIRTKQDLPYLSICSLSIQQIHFHVTSLGTNAVVITRVHCIFYCYRSVSMTDIFFKAFIQASQRKRATFLLLEMSKNTAYGGLQPNTHQGVPLPSIPTVEEEEGVTYFNQGRAKSNNSSSNSEDFDMTEELEVGSVLNKNECLLLFMINSQYYKYSN